jgi:hypothetical protein
MIDVTVNGTSIIVLRTAHHLVNSHAGPGARRAVEAVSLIFP